MRIKIIFLALAVMVVLCAGTVLADGNEGFISGKITTREGNSYEGLIRWGTQEYFWDDLYNATKEDNPWLKYVDKHEYPNRHLKIFGMEYYNSFGVHLFSCRFGDIEWIEYRRSGVIVHTKGGSSFEVEGSGDNTEDLTVIDKNLGKITVDGDKIAKVEFADTPGNIEVPGYRLYGKVKSWKAEYEGFIMWDAEECISTDILDGDTEEGSVKIEFVNIKSIVKRDGGDACEVTLKDGRILTLDGSNDVDSGNRGIYVLDKKYGKLQIPWGEFDQLTYTEPKGTGEPYMSYKPFGKLKGTVKATGNGNISGDIVFDLDETEGFEFLDGMIDDVSFYIPFGTIISITPKSGRMSVVKLNNGVEMLLEEAQDVSKDNDGILIFSGKDKPKYTPWDEVEEVKFK